MSAKADWEPRPCPGGCGHLHRGCCDSVIGSDHQSSCEQTNEAMRRTLLRPAALERALGDDGPDPSRPASFRHPGAKVPTP